MINNDDFQHLPNGARIHNYSIIGKTVIIRPRVTIWAFCRIFEEVVLGDDVSIGTGVYIGAGTVIASNTRIGDGCHITDHMCIGENVFVAPHVVFCNDRYPVVGNKDYKIESPRVEDDVSIGVNSTILPGVCLGSGCKVGAGAVVVRDVPPGMVVAGNPARILHREEVDTIAFMHGLEPGE